MNKDKDEWGNIELPGFGDDKLLSPTINKRLSNIEKGKIAKEKGTFKGVNNPMYGLPGSFLGKNHLAESLIKMSNSQEKTWEDDTVRKKRIESMNNPDSKNKKSQSLKESWADPEIYIKRVIINNESRTEEVCAKISKSLTGIKRGEQSKLHKDKLSAAQKGIPKPIHVCPHCNKKGAGPVMKRFHFDNCKHKS